MRIIDADSIDWSIVEDEHGKRSEPIVDCEILIENQTTIDLVRCKECKHEPICSHSVQHTTHEPTSVTIGYKTVEWCSYGEREGE